jgi:hypothetical protein
MEMDSVESKQAVGEAGVERIGSEIQQGGKRVPYCIDSSHT